MLACLNKHRKPWTPQEDQALVCLKEKMKIANWPEIAKKMLSIFRLQGRTQKQCRDRYVNFLRNVENSYTWRTEDQKKLTELYYELGNKWSEIATYFPNTNGIYIKNKFYSRLRKAIRHLNMVIQSHFYQLEKPFSFNIIFKLVNNASHKHSFNQSSEVKDILEANPNFFEDVILQLVRMTDDSPNNLLKKKKMHRLHLKDENTWRKIIEILKFLEKQVNGVKMSQHFQKDFHLQTDNHQGIRSLATFGIQGFLGFPKNCGQEPNGEQGSLDKLAVASYIQLEEVHQSMPKRRNKIIIVSDQKRFYEKNREVINPPTITLSKKEETLSIKETQSPLMRQDAYDDRILAVLGKDEMKPVSLQHNIPVSL